ncbi:hypothetical protein STSP_29080 [Streptomyces jeddahensis]|uniref:Glutamine synthetase n=1 Tax=Streptomyces jeddahensis TaxID=1716141 RepID=A0A177HTA7_9ACTN|nr:hypothetical protein STSP_29080 [Streptomyces jeddahensis]
MLDSRLLSVRVQPPWPYCDRSLLEMPLTSVGENTVTSAPLASRFGWLLRRRRSSEVAPAPHHFLRNKRQEWEEYRSEVTAFELRKNLPML